MHRKHYLPGPIPLPHKNPIPNVLIVGRDSNISVANTPNMITTSKMLIAMSIRLNMVSHLSWPLDSFNLLFSTKYWFSYTF